MLFKFVIPGFCFSYFKAVKQQSREGFVSRDSFPSLIPQTELNRVARSGLCLGQSAWKDSEGMR